MGWNNDYILENGVYRLEPYNLFGFIPIIGVSILKKDGEWRLRRECDLDFIEGTFIENDNGDLEYSI